MVYVSVQQAAATLGVSDDALLDWMDRGLITTEPGAGGTRRIPPTALDAVLRVLPTHSAQHGLTEAQVEAILVRGAGHDGQRRDSSRRRHSGTRRATPWQTVKAVVSALLEWHWP